MPVSTREERRQQRKVDRQEAQRKAQQQARMRQRFAIGGGAVLAVAVIAILAVFFAGHKATPASPLPGTHFSDPTTAAGQLYQHVPDTQPVKYDQTPPNHGNHYDTPRPPGAYDVQIPDGYFVHDLEHGAMVVLYHCPSGCADTVTQLKGLLTTLPRDPQFNEVKVVISPYDKLDHQIALLAWDYEEDLDSFDLNTIKAFYQAHLDKGPEHAPI